MKSRFLCVPLLISSVLGLSGCWTIPKTPGCEVRYTKGSEWVIGGVKIPVSAATEKVVEIGNLKYTGPQAQLLSDGVAAMDQNRMSLCAIIYAPGFATMSEYYRARTYDKLFALNDTIVTTGQLLTQAKTQEEGLNLVTKQQQTAKEIVNKPVPVTPAASSPNVVDGGVDVSVRNDVASLKSRVEGIDRQVTTLLATGTQRLKVYGFISDGVNLSADKRESVVASVREALSRIPVSRTPNILVIGYADSQGSQNYNVTIALRRAKAVAELLHKHDLGRDFHTEVTSGGVYAQGAGAEARRVEILVSGVPAMRRQA
jgi:outer membrane protein OmpA-like peptidoglycan-associated protein